MKSNTIAFKNPKMKKAFDEPNEWVGLYNKRSNLKSHDKVHIRFSESKLSAYLSITLGKDIHELLEWKIADKIIIQRSNIRTHLIKLYKTTNSKDVSSYKLGGNSAAPNKLYLRCSIDKDNLIFDKTVACEYDISDDGLVLDLSDLLK